MKTYSIRNGNVFGILKSPCKSLFGWLEFFYDILSFLG
jgi:hypothetical protein